MAVKNIRDCHIKWKIEYEFNSNENWDKAYITIIMQFLSSEFVLKYKDGRVMYMPELPEVETVKETLKSKVLHKTIDSVDVRYPNIIEYPTVSMFQRNIKGETIQNIIRRGKWLMFELDHYYLLSHLRMEGKYLIRNRNDEYKKHEHVSFSFTDSTELRYHDTRKFGRMHLVEKRNINEYKIIKEIGLEPWDKELTSEYLIHRYKHKKIPIKTTLLNQGIIAGIGNIYADEILFLCKINPLKQTCCITKKQANSIIQYTRQVLGDAIRGGGTTIRTYESSEGVHGRFQQNLLVHNREHQHCYNCNSLIIKIVVGGRGTYYCPRCQK